MNRLASLSLIALFAACSPDAPPAESTEGPDLERRRSRDHQGTLECQRFDDIEAEFTCGGVTLTACDDVSWAYFVHTDNPDAVWFGGNTPFTYETERPLVGLIAQAGVWWRFNIEYFRPGLRLYNDCPADNDADGDGFAGDADCDDTNADINPDAIEVCDGVDNNCDAAIDEGVLNTFYADADADGFGDAANEVFACDIPIGASADNTDCDDTQAAINPAAIEVCDGVDNNCDAAIDEGVLNTFYADADADGFGDAANAVFACDIPVGASADNTDCDDTQAAINPAATEVCDGIDNDCDTAIDDGDDSVDLSNGLTSYADTDGDGFGDALTSALTCDVPAGNVVNADDCDDSASTINPGATEVCDGIDNDCDAGVDEDVLATFYADADADGFGDATATVLACEVPDGAVANADDCDDTQNAINPAAAEVCDGIDNDCDATVDDADTNVDLSTGSTWFADADADGFGDSATAIAACDAPSGFIGDDTDCDDASDAINPAAAEQCDGIDNDCDALVDLDDDDVDGFIAYTDADGDGYGTGDGTTVCALGDDQAALDGDCDDADGYANPGAIPRCFGRFDSPTDEDRDCDGEFDYVQSDSNTYYVDYDRDGFGGTFFGAITDVCRHDDAYGCEDFRANYTPDEFQEFFPECNLTQNDDDCDDFADTAFPGAQEVCDGQDNDCDGLTDDADDSLDAGSRDFYVDGDGDGFGAGDGVLAFTCSPGDGLSAQDTDCDDTSSTVYPGAPDTAYDGIDSDCNGSDDFDLDGDGYVGVDGGGTDCNDLNPNIRPDATERCDGIDNNCSGLIDDQDPLVDPATYPSTYYADFDGDGFGDLNNAIIGASCLAPPDYTRDTRDCDDSEASTYPGAPDAWYDGVDSDCAGNNDFDQDVDGVEVSSDCDDTDNHVFPGAEEQCDGADTDCDPSTGEERLVSLNRGSSWTEVTGELADGRPDGVINAGAPLWVNNGTLNFCVATGSAAFTGRLTVSGTSEVQTLGNGHAVLDAEEQGSVVRASGQVTLRDLTLTGGLSEDGGGLVVPSGGNITGERLVVTDNETVPSGASSPGGGIYARFATVTLIDSEVSVNEAYWLGGGIYGQDATIVLDGTDVFGNSLNQISGFTPFTFGGGGIALESSSLELTNGSVVRNNLATGQIGGGLSLHRSDATCTDSTIIANGWAGSTVESLSDYSVGRGGVMLWYSSDFIADQCDMGTVAGGNDNYGFDVFAGNVEYDGYGPSTSVRCNTGVGFSQGSCSP